MSRPTSIHSIRASESPGGYACRPSEGGRLWLGASMLLAAIALSLSWPGTVHAQGGTFPADALQKLLAADGSAEDRFGNAVAISGDRAIVGASRDDDYSGSAYVFERAAGGRWREVAKLVAPDGAADDEFGVSVAISGDRAIVGAIRNDDDGNESGSAYVFERTAGGGWSEIAKLVAADAGIFANFGRSVAISGNRAVVGASKGSGNASGSAYVFERAAGGTWNEVAKLIAADGVDGDRFGWSVALSGDRVIVGALFYSSAYVFERAAGGGWNEVAKLVAADGVAGDSFGRSVAISGNRAIVGAPADDDKGNNSGSAYVFERAAGGGWNEVAKLVAADGAAVDRFGVSVALSGARAIVGAFGDDDNGSGAGSAYVFERAAGGGWREVTKLIAPDGAADDSFGFSVALSGGRAIVGAIYDQDNGFDSGSAYVFDLAADLAAPVCNGLAVTVDLNRGDTPTSGNDVILGTPAADTINAMGGNDTICAEGGADVIYAGGGDDRVEGGPGDDVIRGGLGDDELRGQAGDDWLMGNLGADRILGGAGVDEIDGGAGNDILLPGPGATAGSGFVVKGGGGDDVVYGGPDADDIRGNAGDDRLFGRGGGDRINGGPDEDWIDGDAGDDVLNGGTGDDVVQGGAGDDMVRGDLGDDAVLGGEGRDIVEGGGGDDVLVGGGSLGDVCRGQEGIDTATSSCERTFGVP